MTCSCTRSEIIEKEPSVYDDYSIYDSQYGKKTSILLAIFFSNLNYNCSNSLDMRNKPPGTS